MWCLRTPRAYGARYRLRARVPHANVCHTTGKARRCKHIAAVEHILLILFEVVLDKKVDSSPDLGHLDHHPSLREEPSETVLFIIRSSYFGPRCAVVVHVSV